MGKQADWYGIRSAAIQPTFGDFNKMEWKSLILNFPLSGNCVVLIIINRWTSCLFSVLFSGHWKNSSIIHEKFWIRDLKSFSVLKLRKVWKYPWVFSRAIVVFGSVMNEISKFIIMDILEVSAYKRRFRLKEKPTQSKISPRLNYLSHHSTLSWGRAWIWDSDY